MTNFNGISDTSYAVYVGEPGDIRCVGHYDSDEFPLALAKANEYKDASILDESTGRDVFQKGSHLNPNNR